MIDWLREVFTNPAVLSAIQVTFEMAFASTLISTILGVAFGLWLQNHKFTLYLRPKGAIRTIPQNGKIRTIRITAIKK